MALKNIGTKLCRIGHVSVSIFDERFLLLWGGYMQYIEDEGSIPVYRYHDPHEVLLYDPILELWTLKNTQGTVPPCNSGSCGVVLDDCLYIYGGYFGDPDVEGNSNNLYSLNLLSWTWTCIEPTGLKPLHCDKLMGWAFGKCIYFFGGFGTPPSSNENRQHNCLFVMDRSHSWFYRRGWNNQLVMYDVTENEWKRPETFGTPSPRAAMAGFLKDSKVYVMGGRLLSDRMNDLYVLDLNTMKWSENLNSHKKCPDGRSWHSFTAIDSNRALLYGGLSSDGTVLDDVWLYNIAENSWSDYPIPQREKRLWHQSVCLISDWVSIGGVRTNLHTNPQEPLEFASNVFSVLVNPKSLLRSCIEKIAADKLFKETVLSYLPKHLQDVIGMRRRNVLQSTPY